MSDFCVCNFFEKVLVYLSLSYFQTTKAHLKKSNAVLRQILKIIRQVLTPIYLKLRVLRLVGFQLIFQFRGGKPLRSVA